MLRGAPYTLQCLMLRDDGGNQVPHSAAVRRVERLVSQPYQRLDETNRQPKR
jgi:hypothetical protein